MKPIPFAMRAVLGTVVLSLALVGPSLAGPIYDWSWHAGDAGIVDNDAGFINWVETEFNTNNDVLTWAVNFEHVPGSTPESQLYGMSLTLTGGAAPESEAGSLAILYLDGARTEKTLTGFGYNGLDNTTSHMDGSAVAGIQAPDQIVSSLHPGSGSWAFDHYVEEQADGSMTMGFTIDASVLRGHSPLYPSGGSWSGIGFGEQIGVNLKTFYRIRSAYNEGYPTNWHWLEQGGLRLTNSDTGVSDPVPEPASLTLFGLGLGAVGLMRRRRQRSEK